MCSNLKSTQQQQSMDMPGNFRQLTCIYKWRHEVTSWFIMMCSLWLLPMIRHILKHSSCCYDLDIRSRRWSTDTLSQSSFPQIKWPLIYLVAFLPACRWKSYFIPTFCLSYSLPKDTWRQCKHHVLAQTGATIKYVYLLIAQSSLCFAHRWQSPQAMQSVNWWRCVVQISALIFTSWCLHIQYNILFSEHIC